MSYYSLLIRNCPVFLCTHYQFCLIKYQFRLNLLYLTTLHFSTNFNFILFLAYLRLTHLFQRCPRSGICQIWGRVFCEIALRSLRLLAFRNHFSIVAHVLEIPFLNHHRFFLLIWARGLYRSLLWNHRLWVWLKYCCYYHCLCRMRATSVVSFLSLLHLHMHLSSPSLTSKCVVAQISRNLKK